MNKRVFRAIVLIGALAAVFMLQPAAVRGAEIGIYNPGLEGGRAFGAGAITATLEEEGFSVSEFPRMSIENMLEYNVVIIPNTRSLARNEDPRWVDNLRAYVAEAGGAVIFNHDAIGAERSPFHINLFPEIMVPGSVVYKEDREVIVTAPAPYDTDFDYLPGYETGQKARHMYTDRFMFEQEGGLSLLVDEDTRKTVVGLGRVGAGRVVFNGLYGGLPVTHQAVRLEGIDRDVMINAVRWALAGGGPSVTDSAELELAAWRPEAPEEAPGRFAVIGLRTDIRAAFERCGRLSMGFPEHDFIPWEFLHMRNITPDDYDLLVVFAPTGSQEVSVPEEAFENFRGFLDGGGKAIIFLNQIIGGQTENLVLDRIGSKPLGLTRDKTTLRRVVWRDHNGTMREIKNVPTGRGQWFPELAEPEARGSETVGYWHDYSGERHSPAIIRASFGYVLNINYYGSHWPFTASAIAELAPGLAPGVFAMLGEEYSLTLEELGARELSREGMARRSAGERMRREAERRAAVRDYAEANRLILDAERKLIEAYAVSMPAVEDEERIVWVAARAQPEPGPIAASLAEAGFTGIALTYRPGFYPSELDVREAEVDWMNKWVEAAQRHGLKIGANYTPRTIYPGAKAYERAVAEDWRTVEAGRYGMERPSASGRIGVCPARPEVQEYAVAKAVDLVEKYPVDYVLYDAIRWRSHRCYCDNCRERFQEDTGIKVEKWPDDALDAYRDEFMRWGADKITEIVRDAAAGINAADPGAKLGVIVRRGEGRNLAEGQHWWEWSDYVDIVSFMYYTPDTEGLEESMRRFSGLLPEDGSVALMPCLYPGGGYGRGLGLIQLQQMDLQRKLTPAGIYYWHYEPMCDSFLELLRMGPFRE